MRVAQSCQLGHCQLVEQLLPCTAQSSAVVCPSCTLCVRSSLSSCWQSWGLLAHWPAKSRLQQIAWGKSTSILARLFCGSQPSAFALANSTAQLLRRQRLTQRAQVYLPMSYLYGRRDRLKPTPLAAALRHELFCGAYERTNWSKARNQCAKPDLYYPHPLVQVRTLSDPGVVLSACSKTVAGPSSPSDQLDAQVLGQRWLLYAAWGLPGAAACLQTALSATSARSDAP